MIDKYENYILNGEWTSLKEIMLKFAYFQQLQLHLSQKQIAYLLTKIQYQIMIKHEPLVLEAGFIYFFFQKGIISKRSINHKSSKSIRSIKHKSWISTSKINNRTHHLKDPILEEVQEYHSFEDVQMSRSRYDQTVYYNESGRSTIVFFIQNTEIQSSLAEKIRLISREKVRFLMQISYPEQLNKCKVQQQLHRFKLLRLQFGQILYSNSERSEFVFFLKSGSVQIIPHHKKSRAYTLASCGILALNKRVDEKAQCVSQKVQCYIIKREDFQHFFQKNNQTKHHREYEQQQYPLSLTFPRVPFEPLIDKKVLKDSADLIQKDEQSFSPKKLKIPEKRSIHNSLQIGGEREQKKKRRIFLKRHFCNYYNDIYGEFSERKIKQMGLDISNQQNLRLYQIKMLHRKAPSMDQIKSKLKKVRIDKLHQLKERLQIDIFNESFNKEQR